MEEIIFKYGKANSKRCAIQDKKRQADLFNSAQFYMTYKLNLHKGSSF